MKRLFNFDIHIGHWRVLLTQKDLEGVVLTKEMFADGVINTERAAYYVGWDPEKTYYFRHLNPEPFFNITYIETSYVWYKKKLWMCRVTGTKQEPALGCTDWLVVQGNETFGLRFYKTSTGAPYGEYIITRRTNIRVDITPCVFWGEENISDIVTSWQWKRYLQNGEEDIAWGEQHKERSVVLETADMPIGWSMINPAHFQCIAYFEDLDIEIVSDIEI